MFWTNPDIDMITRGEIIEWDIKSANTSIMRYFQLMPDKVIDKLEKKEKENRVIAIGKLMRKNPVFSKELEDGFNEMIQLFLEKNQLDKEEDVVSIKRDAVFLRNCWPTQLEFGPVVFVPKNTYRHYLRMNGLEFYFCHSKDIDVKGLSDEDAKKHANGMMVFLRDVLDSRYEQASYNEYLKDFADAYKKRELPLDYYREMNPGSKFSLNISGYQTRVETIEEEDLPMLDIHYNYIQYVLPMIRLMCG